MNRRGFLAGTLGLLAGAALDPEKLLWVPGKKSIFVPPAVMMPNLDAVNQITLTYLQPHIVDVVFQRDPFLVYLQGRIGSRPPGTLITEVFKV